jgi:hypothetical protein
MTISKMKIKFLGKTGTLYRVLDRSGEVLQVFETQKEAEDFVNAK